jgi:AraC family transcriptional regulator
MVYLKAPDKAMALQSKCHAPFLIVVSAADGQQMRKEPQIVELSPKRLVGMSVEMSRVNDRTGELWAAFMPRRNEVPNRSSDDYISMQVYPNGPEQIKNPAGSFFKWAVVEVDGFDYVPEGMAAYTLQPGTYAVFEHNGPASDLSTVMYIFSEWLPRSDVYELDDREHFEVLPSDYDAQDPEAREHFWIPIKPTSRR